MLDNTEEREFTDEEKEAIVLETNDPDADMVAIAHRVGITPQRLYNWRSAWRRKHQMKGSKAPARSKRPRTQVNVVGRKVTIDQLREKHADLEKQLHDVEMQILQEVLNSK